DITHKLSDELIKMDVKINIYALCGACGGKHLISKLFNLLDQLINRSDLTVRITGLSSELLETLKIIEHCISCKDSMGKYYYGYYEIYESINKIKNYLVELEKGKKEEQEKEDITHKLSDELIKIDIQINRNILCGACGVKHLRSKLTNLLNKSINRSELTVRIIGLSNGLLGTLKIIENCASCKNKIREFYETISLLVESEKGGKKEQDIIYELS